MHNPPLEAKVRVDGVLYDQVVTTDIQVGNLVWDMKDLCYGYVAWKDRKGNLAVKDGPAVEGNIPVTRVRKLIPSVANNSLN